MAKNKFRKLSPASEVKEVESKKSIVLILNFKSIFIGKEAHLYEEYMKKAHAAFTEKYPMVPGHENMVEYREFIKSNQK